MFFSFLYTLKVFPSIVDTIVCVRVCVVNSLDNFKGCKCLTNSLWWKQARYLCESLLPDKIQWCRWRVGRVCFSKPTRNLGVKLTLFQPGGGHCVFKWILRGHLKPTPIIINMFEVIFIKFWLFWSTIDACEIISLT